MKVRFNLNGPYIYLVFRYGADKPFRTSIGHEIKRQHWNNRTMRARSSWPGYVALNGFLDRLAEAASTAQLNAARDGRVATEAEIREALAPYLRRGAAGPGVTLFSFIRDLIAERERVKNVAAGTVKNYRATFKHLEGYAAKYGEPDFKDITPAFLSRFVAYLYAAPVRGGKSMEQSAVAGHVARLKVFLQEATERGYNTNLAFKSRTFAVHLPRADKVYLTVDELIRVFALDLSESPQLEQVRDMALVAAFTGQRFSDFTRISSEFIYQTKDGDRLRFRTVKSGRKTEVIAPVHPLLRAVLERYGGQMPAVHNAGFNSRLKEVCKLAGLTHSIPITTHKGGTAKEELIEKWRLVSAHTLRRTFITNALAANLPPTVVMDVVGIKKLSTLERYNVIEAERSAQIVAASDFFRGDRFLRAL